MRRHRLLFSSIIIAVIVASAAIPVGSQGSAALQAEAKKLTAGRNVNMVSGTTLPNGDPWLQRQNEPSIAVSTRNPLHLLAGSNDYRTVDMPLENEQLPGREGLLATAPDAWLGLYKSVDGGQSWASTLVPGFPQDTTAAGTASPLKYTPAKRKGFTAAADPVVRSGPAGMFYYSGIAFNRTRTPGWVNGSLFVSRFIDKNNVEAGDPAQYGAIAYVDTKVIATDGRLPVLFIDKPWIAVDAPLPGASPINISGQMVPRHNVYIAYSIFIEAGKLQTSTIIFMRSRDCGNTWGSPLILSLGSVLNQGATIAVDPRDGGNVYVAWRRFDTKKQTSAIMVARSKNKGASFESAKAVVQLTSLQGPFDQPATIATDFPYGTSFRTNSYPTMAVDDKGIVYLAWTQRGHGPTAEARIMLATSGDGKSWSLRGPIDSQAAIQGHQFMPSLAFAAGKLTMAWYDQRDDFCGLNLGFDNWISDGLPYRHTIDVRAAQADTADFPNLRWDTIQVSRYHFTLEEDSDNKGKYKAFQSQWNPPNYPLFATGTLPFHGDYIDVAPSPMFLRGADGRWRFNTAVSDNPLFHITWTDNRDVRPPSDGNWTNYAPPTSQQPATYISPGRPICAGGQQPGMRNQNIYTAQLVSGIEAGSPTNAKALDLDVPRAFAVFVKNNTWMMRSFRLTIAAQPPTGQASFLQFDPLDYLDVTIAPYSTISRQVFISSTDSKASVRVDIEEINMPGGSVLPEGMTGSVLINGDPTSTGVVGGEETHQPQIENPHIRNWSVNAISVNPEIENEDIVNTDIVNPNIVNLDDVDPALVNPNVVDPNLFNPHIRNSDYLNPSFVNPHIRNPHIRNESPEDASVTDVEWPVKNTGNTASSFSFTLIAKEALPEGLYAQLIVYKVHYTPAVAGEALQNGMDINGCELKREPHHEILLNIVNPDLVNPDIRNPNLLSPHIRNAAIENATFVLGPGEEAIVSLRIIESHEKTGMMRAMTTLQGFELPIDVASFVESVGAAVTAQSVDSEDAAQGIEEPKSDSTALVISTSSLPPGTIGLAYPPSPYTPADARIQAVGGVEPYSWWVNPNELPPGLIFSAATGQITGLPLKESGKTYPRVYSFTVQVTDTGSPQQSANQRFSIVIEDPAVPPPPLTITTPSPLPVGTEGKPYGTSLSAVGGVWPYTWQGVSGTLPPGLFMDELGTIGGTPNLPGTYSFTVSVTDSASPAQTLEKGYSLTIRAAEATTFSISGIITLGIGGSRLPDVLLRGLPSAPSTDASGSYSDTVPAGWSGTAVPFKAGYYFVPAEIAYANVQSQRLNQNYVAYPLVLDHFDISAVGNTAAGAPFTITITAKDSSGDTVTTYTDSNALTDTTGTISPKMTGAFVNGVWSGQVAVMKAAADVIIQTTGGGRTGQSNAFNVLIGSSSAIRIEDASGGTGAEVLAKTLGPGLTLTLYAISRDLGGNYTGNVPVVWSLIAKSGGVVDGDLVPSADETSAVFTAHAAGTCRISAQHASLGADATGTITVMAALVDDAYEDNDDRAGAAPLLLGAHTNLVLMDPDWFKITVPPGDAGKDLMIHLQGTSYPNPDVRRDLDMMVFDGSGRMLAYNGSGGDDEYAFVPAVAAGDYYIGQTYMEAPGIVYSLTAQVGTNFGIGTIEGRVTDPMGGGVENVLVELYGEPFHWDNTRPTGTTDANGYYRIGFFPGKYTVRFNILNPDWRDPLIPDVNYVGETYNDNQVLTVVAGASVPNINAQIEPGGAITGRVTDPQGNGLDMATVSVHAGDAVRVAAVLTNDLGHYVADRLPTGNYKVRVRQQAKYGQEWYGEAPSLAAGLPVRVVAGSTTPGIDIGLEEDGAHVQGRVADSQGNPIAGVTVAAFDEAGINITGGVTDESGNYDIPRLTTGEVRIYFNATTATGNYYSKYFPNADLLSGAVPVPVTSGETTPNIDAQLAAGGSIMGRVTDSLGNGIPGISILAVDTNSDRSYFSGTDRSGNYTLAHIRPDDYKVLFRPERGSAAAVWYDNWNSSSGAKVVTVPASQAVPNINAQLVDVSGSISGTVTAAGPIENVTVLAYDSSRGTAGAYISAAATAANGTYRLKRLPGADYKVYFNADTAFLGYGSEYYAGKTSFGEADPITVPPSQDYPNIGAILMTRPHLDIATTSLPDGRQSQLYTASLDATGGRPFYYWTFESGSLPGGLTLNSKGEIRGMPTTAGTFDFTVRAIDSTLPQQSDTQSFTITIAAYGGTGYVISGTVGGGAGAIAGVVMDGLPGSPVTNALGEYSATVSSGWSGTVTPTLVGHVFTPPNRTYTNTTSHWPDQNYTATAGFAISGTITLGGAPLPGVLMAGLPGEPRTNAGGFYTASVPSGWSGTVSPTMPWYSFEPLRRSYTNVLAPIVGADFAAYSGGSLSVSTGAAPSGRTGSSYDYTILAQGGTPPYSWTIAAGRLPGGLTLDSGGRLSGTPTEGGEFPWTVRVVDSSSPPLFATATFSLFVNPDHQGQWTTTYPLGGQIRPMGLVTDPANTNTPYAIVQQRGLYRSMDGGANWTNFIETNYASGSAPWFNARNFSIFLIGKESQFYLAGNPGLYRSLNRGTNWARVDSGFSGRLIAMALDPGDGNIIYAGTQEGKVYRSANGGTSWSDISAGLPATDIRFLAVDPGDPSKIYAGTGSNGIYRRTGGGTWVSINGAWAGDQRNTKLLRVETIVFNPTNTANILIAAQDAEFGEGIYKTADSGTTWSRVEPQVGVRWEPGYYVAFNPADPNVFYAVNGGSVRVYTGGGTGFNDYSVAASNLNCLAVDPVTRVLYAGTDGDGLYKSADGGQNWTAVNNNIRGLSFAYSEAHNLHFDASNPNIIYGGSINGGYRSLDGGNSWERMDFPAWQANAFATNASIPGTVFAIADRVYKSTTYGISGSWTSPSGGAFYGFWNSDLVTVPGAPNVLYAGVYGPDSGFVGVYKSVNGGADWAAKNEGLTDTQVSFLTIHPTNPSILFAGTGFDDGNQRLFRTLDGGESWQQVTCGLPSTLGVTQVVFSPSDPNIVYLSAFGTNSGCYKSLDGGSCWVKLDSSYVGSVAVHPANPDIVYLGVSGGFYVSFNGGQSWTAFMAGLHPRPMVHGLTLDPQDPLHVFVGTDAGVFEAMFDFDLVVNTATLPDAAINEPYIATLKAAGGTTPYSWSMDPAGPLPAGLSLDPVTGIISGLAASAGQFTLQVRVADNGGRSCSKPLALNVLAKYSLATAPIPPEGGAVIRNPDETLYTQGAVVGVTAVSNSGYAFIGWSGDISGTVSSERLVMMGSRSIQANFALTSALPDYVVSSAAFPGSAAAGEMISGSVNITVGNEGAGTVNPPLVSAAIYLSNDAVITPDDIPLWKGRVFFAPPGSAGTRALPIDSGLQIPATIAPGIYSIGVIVDDANTVVELNENNNSAARTITVSATGTSYLELLGGWPYGSTIGIDADVPRRVVLRGHGGLVEIVDISNVAHPTVVSRLDVGPGQINGIKIIGNLAYFAGGTKFFIADISDLHNPQIVGSCGGLVSNIRDLDIVGNHAYVSDYHYGLRVIDISTSTAPVVVGSLPLPNGRTRLVRAFGNMVYVTRHTHVTRPYGIGGLSIVDVSDPANPVERAFLNMTIGDLAVDKNGRYVFLFTTNGLKIYDVSDPDAPFEAASYGGLYTPAGIRIISDRAYLTDATQNRVFILDIADPLHPIEVSSYQFPDATSLARPGVAGNLCLVPSWYDALRIVDFSNLNSPVQVGFLETVGLSNFVDVADGHAYVSTARTLSNRMKVLDLTNLPSITETASLATSYYQDGVVADGIYAYLANSESGVHSIDVSDPAHPLETGLAGSAPRAQDIVISGSYAYVADGPGGLKIFDVRTPGKPGLIGACPTPGPARQLAVSGRYAYLACDSGGLRIIDISNPQNPQMVGSHVFSESVYNVAVWANHAYVVNTTGDILWVVDVSDPSNPMEKGAVDVYYCYGDVGFSGHYMFVPNTFFGLKVFDISDPDNPVEVAIDRRLASSHDVLVRENRIYVVDRDAGLYVLEFRTQEGGGGIPPLTVTTTSLPGGELGVFYSATLQASGGKPSYSWSLESGALPNGLNLNGDGNIQGTPTATGAFDFVARVTDSAWPRKSVMQAFTIAVAAYAGSGHLISGRVMAEATPVPGVVLTGLPGSPISNSFGEYVASVSSGWSGTVTPTLAGYAFDPPVRSYTNAASTLQNQDFKATVGHAISGTVTLNGTPLPGVLMSGLPGEPRTDASGFYTAAVPSGWSGTATPTLPGYTFNPPNRPYSGVAANQTAQDYMAAYAGGADDTYEDNDSYDTAAVILPGTYTDLVMGGVAEGEEQDWFKVYVSDAGKILRAHVKGTSYPHPAGYRDLDFCIVSEARKLLSYNFSGSDDETIYLTDLTEGWYFIGLNYGSQSGAVYSLSIDIGTDFGIGFIEGRITDKQGHDIEGVAVELYGDPFDAYVSRPLIMTKADGTYKLGWAPGNCTVRFNLQNFNHQDPFIIDPNYIGETYHFGQVIALAAGSTTDGIDAQLEAGGVISGKITDSEGHPVAAGYAQAFASNLTAVAIGRPNADGVYIADRLPAGNYKVRFRPNTPGLGLVWYGDAPSFDSAMPVPVTAGQTTPDVNGRFGPEGSIEGVVTNGSGAPIQDVTITAYDVSGISLWSARTDADGFYQIKGLPDGPAKLFFNPPATDQNYVAEYYPDKFLIGEAEPVMVTVGGTSINAQLAEGGRISGRVTDAAGNGLQPVAVFCHDIETDRYYSATTDPNGYYSIPQILPDVYKIRIRGGVNLALEWFDGKADFISGDTVSVGAGQHVQNINVQLEENGGFITGRVTDFGGAPIGGVAVYARDPVKMGTISAATTDPTGSYTLRRLPSGEAKVQFDADTSFLAYATEYYNDKPTYEAGDPIGTARGGTRPGIDAALGPIQALDIATTSIPSGQQFSSYGVLLLAAGGRPFHYWTLDPASDPLPAGLILTGKGEIVGTPLATGTYNLVVRVTDSTRPQQSNTQSLTLTVNQYSATGYYISGHIALGAPGGPPLAGVVLEGLPGPPATNLAGDYITFVPAGYTGMARPVLAGYGFDPETDGYTDINVNRPGQDYVAYKVTLVVVTDWLSNGTEGQAYAQILEATGGTSPYKWSLYSGILPDGLTLDPDGTLSGTSVKTGTYEFTVRVTDSGTPTQRVYQAYAVTINSGGLITVDPILVWKLNESQGTTALDSSGRGLHGVLNNSVSHTSDAVGGWGFAAETAGNGWIEKGWGGDKTFYFANAATIMAYVKISDFNNPRRFVWKLQHDRPDRGFPYTFQAELSIEGQKLVVHTSNGLLKGVYNSPGFATEVDLPASGFVLDAYNHLAVAIHGDQYTIFVNGAEKVTGTGAPFNASADFQCFWVMGASWSDYWLGGKIDEITVYNTALSPAQVGARYTEGPLATVSGRVTSDGMPLSGVALQGLPGNPLTNDAGDYVGSVPPGWSGTISPVRVGYSFEPLSRSYTNVLLPIVGEDYVAYVGGLGINTYTLPIGKKDLPYDFTLVSQTAVLPATWAIISGRLPAGLYLATDGHLSGTPTEAGIFPWTVRLIDSYTPSRFATRALTLTIRPPDGGFWTTSYPEGGEIFAQGLALDPADPNIVFASANTRGVFRSDNGAENWSSNLIDSPGWQYGDHSYSIFIAHRASGNFYMSTGARILRSADRGATWTEIYTRGESDIEVLAVDPANANTIYAGMHWAGVVKTTDGGVTWSPIGTGLPQEGYKVFVIDPVTPQVLYAGVSDKGIYKSTDGGATWSPANGSMGFDHVEDLKIDPVTPNTVYALGWTSTGPTIQGVFKTIDGGGSWTHLSDASIGGGWTGGGIAIDPTDTDVIYVASGGFVLKSGDAGESWVTYPVSYASTEAIVIDTTNTQVLYAGTAGAGVYKSLNGGLSWVPMNNGMHAIRFEEDTAHAIEFDKSDPVFIYAGSVGGGYRSLDHGANWETMGFPRGGPLALRTHRDVPGTVFGIRNSFHKSTANGANQSWQQEAEATCCFPRGDLAVSTTSPLVIYFGCTGSGGVPAGIHKSTDGGDTFTLMNNGLTNTEIHSIAVHPTNPDIVYAGTRGGNPFDPGTDYGLFKTVDGGDHWTHVGGLPHDLDIRNIVIHPSNPDIIYFATGGDANTGIYRSGDGGVNWMRMSTQFAYVLAVDPTDPSMVFAGDDSGFWVSFTNGSSLRAVNSGLVAFPCVQAISVDPANARHILIGTVAGVYEATFDFAPEIGTGSLPVATINQHYDAWLDAARGTPPYTWSIGGALPDGFSLDPDTGQISGQTADLGIYAFDATVVDAIGRSFTRGLSITVVEPSTTGMYPLAATASPPEGGKVTRDPIASLYVEGTSVTLAAVPNPGYTFIGWSGASLSKTSPVQILMTEPKSVSAHFAATNTLPDYSIASATFPSLAAAGETIGGAVNITVGNLWAGTMNPPALSAGVYLSNDALVTPEDILLWKGRVLFVPPGSMETRALPIDPNLQIPTTVAAGTYTIGVIVDDTNAVAEFSEINNASSQTITITSSGYGHLELLGGWPYGSSMGIEIDESRNVALRGHGGLLEILDISDPSHPTVMSQLNLGPSQLEELKIRGNYAYLTGHELFVVDITDLHDPRVVGSCPVQSFIRDLEIVGDSAIVSDYQYGLRVIDISDPSAPVIVGSLPFNSRTRLIEVTENIVFVTRGTHLGRQIGVGGLSIVDISTPSNPVELNFLQGFSAGQDMALDKTGGYLFTFQGGGVIKIYDVSNPAVPVEAGSYGTSYLPGNIRIVGDRAYLSDAKQNKIAILNISNPLNPSEISTYEFPGPTSLYKPAVAGNLCLVSSWYDSLKIVDFTNLSSPVERGSLETVGLSNYADVANGYAYVETNRAASNRLKVLNLANLPNFTETASLETSYSAIDVVTSGIHAYLAASNGTGLHVVDVSDPAHPTEAAANPSAPQAQDVVIVGSYAYVADGSNGLKTFDIRIPANPILVGSCATPDYAYQLFVAGGYAYVACDSQGLRIIDISDPANPREVGSHIFSGDSAYNVAVWENNAYVVNYAGNHLWIVDVSDPENPVERAPVDLYYCYGDMGFSGHYLFIPNMFFGLTVVDISNPASPVEVEVDSRFSSPDEVLVRENRIYIVNRDTGFYALEFRLR